MWLLGALAALLKCGIGPGMRVDLSVPQWFFLHPLSVSWAYLLNILGVRSLNRPDIFRAWLGLNCLIVPVILVVGAVAYFYYCQRYGWTNRKEPRFVDDPTCGTVGWLKLKEAKNVFRFNQGPGILFGKLDNGSPVILPPEAPGNRNVVVFAPPGRMKSRGYVRNNLLQAVLSYWSVISTDPKGELTQDFRLFFKRQGYTVRVFNLVDMMHSDRWNPLDEVKQGVDAQILAQVIIDNTENPSRKSKDEFWSRAEMNLLKALILFVVINCPPGERNLGTLYSILSCGSLERIDALFQTLPPNHPAKIPYNIYRETSSTVRSGVVIGLGTRLQVFQETLVQKLTEKSDIDLELPGREKCAYFCIISDMDTTYYFLASLFFSFLFIKLIRLADRNGGKLPVFVNFLLDEFCNIGKIPDFTTKISTMRGRGIGCSIIFQSINQLEEHYPEPSWETILADCDSWLVMGCRDNTTAEYISKHFGEGTVQSVSLRRDAGIEGLMELGSITYSPHRRRLLTPDEVVTFDDKSAILTFLNMRPFRIKKMDFTEHELSKELVPVPVQHYTPSWSIGMFNADDLFRFSPPSSESMLDSSGTEKLYEQTDKQIEEINAEEFSSSLDADFDSDADSNASNNVDAFWG